MRMTVATPGICENAGMTNFMEQSPPKDHIIRNAAAVFVAFILAFITGTCVVNRFNTSYDSLRTEERALLDQYSKFAATTTGAGKPVWDGFDLASKPVLFVGHLGRFSSFLINPEHEPNPLVATRITMPKGSPIRVYRISESAPSLLNIRLRFASNFTSENSVQHALGNKVFYVKTSLTPASKNKSGDNALALLSHEAMHYYMQRSWPSGGQHADGLRSEDMKFIYQQLDQLDIMREETETGDRNKDAVKRALTEYVRLIDELAKTSPEFVRLLNTKLTDEGTAEYVKYHALRAAGAKVHQIDDGTDKHFTFPDLKAPLETGVVGKDWLMGRQFPYYVGAQLAEALDIIGADGWQAKLNAMTRDNPLTLVDVIRQYLRTL